MDTELLQILETIKNLLKSSGVRYEDLAEELGMSLASVKRILNGKDLQVSKLIKISKILGLNFFELIEQSKTNPHKRYMFTLKQETLLSKNFKNFLIFRLIILGHTKKEILQKLSLTESFLNTLLRNFEKVDLIELHPGDKIKMKVSFPFEWMDNGPLEKAYNEVILKRINREINQAGINRSKIEKENSQINVKELLLNESEGVYIKNELAELIKKYEILTKVRLKSSDSFQVFSISTILGRFSWWD